MLKVVITAIIVVLILNRTSAISRPQLANNLGLPEFCAVILATMSTTEESDWEASGPGIRPLSEPPLPGPEPPSIPILTSEAAPVGRTQSPQVAQDGGSNEMMTTLASTENAREKDLEDTATALANFVSVSPTANPILSDASPSMNQDNSDHMAAQDIVLSQMITSQDIDVTPSQRAFMEQVSGRGSRGGRGSCRSAQCY